MKHTIAQKEAGEYACRYLSEKASKVYESSDPLSVYEVETDFGVFYDCEGVFEMSHVSFEEMQSFFESFFDEIFDDDDDE